MQCFSLFNVSKGSGDYYNINKHGQSDGLIKTESTANTYEQTTPSELIAGEHLYEILPASKYSIYSFSFSTV